jgi:hypothetical protein
MISLLVLPELSRGAGVYIDILAVEKMKSPSDYPYFVMRTKNPLSQKWNIMQGRRGNSKLKPIPAKDDGQQSLPHSAAEADYAAFANFQRIGEFATDYERVAFVGLGREFGIAAALGAAFDVFQTGAEAVDDRHVADGLVADVIEADGKPNLFARQRIGRGG